MIHASKNATMALAKGARFFAVRLEIKLPFTTTGSFTQMPPAFSRLSLTPSEPVNQPDSQL
jgi:hypothetical protein